MPRSSPSPTPDAGPGAAPPPGPSETPARAGGPTLRRKLNLRLAAVMRWTHIYLSMFGLAVLLFFSATGITGNHPDWFYGGAEPAVQAQENVTVGWLPLEAPRAEVGHETDDERRVA